MDSTSTPKKRKPIPERDWTAELTKLKQLLLSDPSLKEIKFESPWEAQLAERNAYQAPIPAKILISIRRDAAYRVSILLECKYSASLEEGYKLLKPTFSYQWSIKRKEVIIKRFLGSLDPKVIEQNVDQLIAECILFHRMYSKDPEEEIAF